MCTTPEQHLTHQHRAVDDIYHVGLLYSKRETTMTMDILIITLTELLRSYWLDGPKEQHFQRDFEGPIWGRYSKEGASAPRVQYITSISWSYVPIDRIPGCNKQK